MHQTSPTPVTSHPELVAVQLETLVVTPVTLGWLTEVWCAEHAYGGGTKRWGMQVVALGTGGHGLDVRNEGVS